MCLPRAPGLYDHRAPPSQELRQVLGETFSDDEILEVLKQADTSGDGKLDYDEFLAYFHTPEPDACDRLAWDRVRLGDRKSGDGVLRRAEQPWGHGHVWGLGAPLGKSVGGAGKKGPTLSR